jgi:hypothetical protein
MTHPDAIKTRRAFGALFWGAVLGAFLTAILVIAPAFVAPAHFAPSPTQVAVTGVYVFVFAIIVWLIGLLTLGAAFWAALHAAGFRDYYAAAALGFILCFAVTLAPAFLSNPGSICYAGGVCHWKDGRITIEGFRAALSGALIYGMAGAIVGLYVRFLAYRDA